jgi:hypothetical protein
MWTDLFEYTNNEELALVLDYIGTSSGGCNYTNQPSTYSSVVTLYTVHSLTCLDLCFAKQHVSKSLVHLQATIYANY